MPHILQYQGSHNHLAVAIVFILLHIQTLHLCVAVDDTCQLGKPACSPIPDHVAKATPNGIPVSGPPPAWSAASQRYSTVEYRMMYWANGMYC